MVGTLLLANQCLWDEQKAGPHPVSSPSPAGKARPQPPGWVLPPVTGMGKVWGAVRCMGALPKAVLWCFKLPGRGEIHLS